MNGVGAIRPTQQIKGSRIRGVKGKVNNPNNPNNPNKLNKPNKPTHRAMRASTATAPFSKARTGFRSSSLICGKSVTSLESR